MKLIIGGAYQGKLDYALKHYGREFSVDRGDTTRPEIDFSKDIIDSLHRTILAQLRSGVNVPEYFENNLDRLGPKIVICDDISSGVVPIDPEMRLWRESVGRTLVFLSGHAGEVVRLFCGIATRIK